MQRVLLTAMCVGTSALVREMGSASPASPMPVQDRLIITWQTTPGGQDEDDEVVRTGRITELETEIGETVQHVRQMEKDSVLGLSGQHTDTELEAVITQLKQNPNVADVQVDIIMQPSLMPNDPYYLSQWHYQANTGPRYGMNLPSAWDLTTGGPVTVAVVDTGYLPHVDLAGKILPGYDFITDPVTANDGDGRDATALDSGDSFMGMPSTWHGTHISGTIAGLNNNGIGISGVSWGARILPVRVLGVGGGRLSDILDGLRWAAGLPVIGVPTNPNPAQVINLSLEGISPCIPQVQAAINDAVTAGAVVVVAAGNFNISASLTLPANCQNVIVVGAHGITGNRAYYSNHGPAVDILAPGGDLMYGVTGGILSTLNTGITAPGLDTYAWYQGTSMAAPHIAGLAALMLTANPALKPGEMKAIIKSTARPFPVPCPLGCGFGLADAKAAVSAALVKAAAAAAAAGAGAGAGAGAAAAVSSSLSSSKSPATSASKSPVNSASKSQAASTSRSPIPSNSISPVYSGSISPAPSDSNSPIPSNSKSPMPSDSASPSPAVSPILATATLAAVTNGLNTSGLSLGLLTGAAANHLNSSIALNLSSSALNTSSIPTIAVSLVAGLPDITISLDDINASGASFGLFALLAVIPLLAVVAAIVVHRRRAQQLSAPLETILEYNGEDLFGAHAMAAVTPHAEA